MKFISHWSFEVSLVICVALLLSFTCNFILNALCKKIQKTKSLWKDVLIEAMRLPLMFFIWVGGIYLASLLIQKQTNWDFHSVSVPARNLGMIALFAWFLFRLVKSSELKFKAVSERKGMPLDKTTAEAIGKILRVAIVIGSLILGLQAIGMSVSGLLAFGGVGGIAVGFAAKDMLANFFGAFTLYMDRPFSVGDWIRSPDREMEGFVEHIGWRLTRIRTLDRRPLYIPNSLFSTITIENPSRMSHRRMKELIGIRYDDFDQIRPLLKELREMLKTHPEIDKNQTHGIYLDNFGPSALEISLYAFTKRTNWLHYREVREDIFLRTYAIIRSHGAEIAYPTSTIHLGKQDLDKEKKAEVFLNASSMADSVENFTFGPTRQHRD